MSLPIITSPRTESQLRSALSRLERAVSSLAGGGGGGGGGGGSGSIGFEDEATLGGTVTAGDVVYPSGNNQVSRARANAEATAKVAGIAVDSGVAGGTIDFQFVGIVEGFSGLTAGNFYYLSAVTAGAIVSPPDAVVGQFIVPVGLAMSSTALLLQPGTRILL